MKVSKIKLFPNVKRSEKNCPKLRLINIIKLAQFSGVEVCEKSKPKLRNSQNIPSLFQLEQKLNAIREEFKAVITNVFPDIIPSGKSLLLDLRGKNLSHCILERLKIKRLQYADYLRDIITLVSDKIKIPYTDKLCSDVPVKQFFTILNDSMIISPRLLVHHIIGENTTSHNANVKNLKRLYSSYLVDKLFRIKRKILSEFCEYTSTDNLMPDYKFSKVKVKKLKKLAEKYDAIDDLLKQHNIHTSAIEALFCSGVEKCFNAGDILPNKDVMLGFSTVYDRSLRKNIPVILSFANTDMGYRFKAYRYDEDLILNIEKYKKQFSHCLKTGNYNQINDLENKILKYLKTIEVSEVYVEPKDLVGLRKEMEKCPDMSLEKIAEILNNSKNDTVYFIKNLKNYNIDRYYNVSIPLIKVLMAFGKSNKINEVYTEALAFDNVKHSPIGMYMRCGFKPISIQKEEIEKGIYSRAGFDYKRSVWLVYKL